VKTVDINPKVMPTEDLYGHISMATREWKDGLLSAVMRDLGRIPNENPKWMIMDGDLDANWIESMNSVMDDNKVGLDFCYNFCSCDRVVDMVLWWHLMLR
jgi:dynein heavy chain